MQYEIKEIDEEEQSEEEIQNVSKYRDRAEERRLCQNEDQNKDIVDIDGQQIKLKGLDYELIAQQPNNNKNNTNNTKSLIQSIRSNLQQIKTTQIKKTIHPMALKIEQLLNQNQQQQMNIAHNIKQEHYYIFDLDMHFGKNLPTHLTKSIHQKQSDIQIEVKLDQYDMNELEVTLKSTQYCTTINKAQRFEFEQKPLKGIEQNDDEDDEDIFGDAKILEPQNRKLPNQIEEDIQQEEEFDPSQYVQKDNVLNKEYYEQLEKEVQEERVEKDKKLRKQQQMLTELEDYYMECYQPIGLSIEEEKERKQEVERQKQLNPDYVDKDFIKKDRIQRKKKKGQNLDKQIEQIENVLQKKTKL